MIDSGAFDSACGAGTGFGAAAARGGAARTGAGAGAGCGGGGGGGDDGGAASSVPPIWSARMVTVWIFFGSGDTAGGAIGAAAAGRAGVALVRGIATADGAGCGGAGAAGAMAAGAAGAGLLAVPEPIIPARAAFGSGKIGIVETTRGAGFAGVGMSTGCSSRETSFSPEPARFASACVDGPDLGLLGTILFGPSSALMIGGSDGKIDAPNMAR